MTIFRLSTSGGDKQDFTDLRALLSEAGKFIDPDKLAASWVYLTVVDPEEEQ